MVIADHHAKLRASLKTITTLEDERDKSVSTLAAAVLEHDVLVKDAARATAIKERHHYAAKVAAETDKVNARDVIINSLTDRCIKAERGLLKSRREGNQSARRADDVTGTLATTKQLLCESRSQEGTLQKALDELQRTCDRTTESLTEMEAAVPIKSLSKTRNGQRGRPSWPNYVWEAIIEQLVIGVPPKAVYRSIASQIKRFSPSTGLNPISMTTILRARTVLLVVVQTLASYRLGKADMWGQLFHDATSRRQISFQNLVISIEEDELFK